MGPTCPGCLQLTVFASLRTLHVVLGNPSVSGVKQLGAVASRRPPDPAVQVGGDGEEGRLDILHGVRRRGH